jgi:hypothetical protein
MSQFDASLLRTCLFGVLLVCGQSPTEIPTSAPSKRPTLLPTTAPSASPTRVYRTCITKSRAAGRRPYSRTVERLVTQNRSG